MLFTVTNAPKISALNKVSLFLAYIIVHCRCSWNLVIFPLCGRTEKLNNLPKIRQRVVEPKFKSKLSHSRVCAFNHSATLLCMSFYGHVWESVVLSLVYIKSSYCAGYYTVSWLQIYCSCALLCDTGIGIIKLLSFASWLTVGFFQRHWKARE